MKKNKMHKEKYLQVIASFLIVLVLTLPFYTINVHATINKVSVKGRDGIDGYAKANDFLNINVQALISNDTITNEQVILGSDIKFDRCTGSITNGSECALRFPSNGTELFEVKSIPLTVNLFKDDKTLDDSKSSSITIDNKAPQVKLAASKNKFSSQQNVVINYEANDFACDDASCSGKCVGIRDVEFFAKNGSFSQKIDVPSAGCAYSSNISIDTNTFSDGKNSIFAKATDKFNQVSSETSVTFEVDITAPIIRANSFSIARKGASISSFSPNKVSVDVVVNISSANDLNPNSVIADLSALNPSQNLRNVKASCTKLEPALLGADFTCKWTVDLEPKTSGVKNIVLNASDTSGNKESITISKTLTLDDKGPLIQSLTIPTTRQSTSLAKASGNTVMAVFEEATGLSVEDVFLHVGSSKLNAKSCSKEANWVCAWENVNFESGAQASIEADTTDVLGNAVALLSALGVTVDKNAPVLKAMNVTNVGAIVPAFPGFFKIGDKIAVEASLTEENDVFAVADFSKFISGAVKVAGKCERIQADEHICTWLTDSINLQASDVATFNFSDNAGNALIATRALKTFGLENTTVPDFWKSTVTCSPKTIDRQLGLLANQRAFCQVKLEQKSATKPVSTVFIGPAKCASDATIVDSIDTFNTEAGSTSPIVRITLKKDELKLNSAALSCTIDIFSKVGDTTTITKNPEIENVKIILEFFNLPLGELEQNTRDKIKEAKDAAEGIFNVIKFLNQLVFYAKKICQIIGIIQNIGAIIFTVAIKLKVVADVQCKSLFLFSVCPILYAAGSENCLKEQGLSETAKRLAEESGTKFCKFVNCQWAPWILGQWQDILKSQINQLPGSAYLPGGLSKYIDPNKNLVTAVAFACVPGVISNLERLRQINCLHADCMQNAVGREGLPLSACERQKSYATCKYWTGELFAIIPYTAVLDHFTGLVRSTLSNPFTLFGAAIGALCIATCPVPDAGASYYACQGAKLLTTVGSVAENVKGLVNEGFKIRQDYCKRLKDIEEENPSQEPLQTNSTRA